MNRDYISEISSWAKFVKDNYLTHDYIKLAFFGVIIFLVYIVIAWLKVPLDITHPELFVEWSKNQGVSFPVAVFAINFLVIILPFLPNDPIHIAAGLVLPWWEAFVIIHTCSMIGWSLNYYLGKKLGSDFVYRIIGADNVISLEGRLKKMKRWHFIILAFTPGVSYDIVGYVCGMIKADFKGFLIGAFIGTAPTTMLSIYYGTLTRSFWWVGPTMFLVNMFAAVVLVSVISFYNKHHIGGFAKRMVNRKK